LRDGVGGLDDGLQHDVAGLRKCAVEGEGLRRRGRIDRELDVGSVAVLAGEAGHLQLLRYASINDGAFMTGR
jgi:hypothetical protein